jgi:hypothetical protein
MADNVTRQEMMSELKSLRNEMRLLLVVTVATLKFNVPDAITATAITAVFIKACWSVFAARIGG